MVMVKLPCIVVPDGKRAIVFPADKSGLGYAFPEGAVPNEVMISPASAIKELGMTPVIALAWSEENQNLVAINPNGKTIDGKLAARLSKTLDKLMGDFIQLKDFFPEKQIEDFAVLAILSTAHITNVTPEAAREMAPSMVGHHTLLAAANNLGRMGFNPNQKAIKAANPLSNSVGSNLLMADEDDAEKDDDA